ncbi:hypothetical protein [Natronoglomus mannanivorans]|uniref:Uncharacterized protein n=1 Tax=Natronoglomus mannanivorans TaxID=2979990 RepID=A0AAP3E403_9EURY|nr:hypothetical protein [Halobacteria archaeon AArc-xg1-1]
MSGVSKEQLKIIKPHLASDEKLKAADRVKGNGKIVAVSDRRLITFYTDGKRILSFKATPLDKVNRVSFFQDREDATDSEMEMWASLFGMGCLLSGFGALYGFIESNDLLMGASLVLALVFLIGAIWASEESDVHGEPYLSVSVETDRAETSRSVTIPGEETNVAAALSEVAGNHQAE